MSIHPTDEIGSVNWSIKMPARRERFWRVANNHLDLYIEITRCKFIE
jgi:hypothetical protein